jgi:hypothetical protein
MVRLSPAARDALMEVLVRLAATAWVLAFIAAVEGALFKLLY